MVVMREADLMVRVPFTGHIRQFHCLLGRNTEEFPLGKRGRCFGMESALVTSTAGQAVDPHFPTLLLSRATLDAWGSEWPV
jgi:hypothetical protein